MMRFFVLILALAAFSAPVRAAAGETAFFETLYDVPVMPGLAEMPDRALVFDKPEGRFAQAGAAGKGVTEQGIRAFYAASLPQLGWQAAGGDSYIREGEKLVLSVGSEGAWRVARFTLSPAR